MVTKHTSPGLEHIAGLPTPSPPNTGTPARQHHIGKIKALLEEFDDILVLVPNAQGDVQALASPNLRQDKWAILKDAHEAYRQYLLDRSNALETAEEETPGPTGRGGGKKPTQMLEDDQESLKGSLTYAQRVSKRRRPNGSNTVSRGPARKQRGSRSRMLSGISGSFSLDPASQIHVGDRESLEHWFREAFLTMQQVACRIVAKVWIKKIHPKKQSTHPYNGGVPRDKPRDPNRTRPPYWPQHITHREPDHIGRDDRINVLVHLILNTPQKIIANPPAAPGHAQYLTAQDLCDCVEEKKDDLQEFEWEILQNVVRTREMMEQYEDGQIDGDSLVFCNDDSVRTRNSRDDSEDSMDERQTVGGFVEDEDHEDQILTPGSSPLQSPGSIIAVDESVGTAEHRRCMTGDSAEIGLVRGHGSRSAADGEQKTPAMAVRKYRGTAADMSARLKQFKGHLEGNVQVQSAVMHDSGRAQTRLHISPTATGEVNSAMTPGALERTFDGISHATMTNGGHTAHSLQHALPNGVSPQETGYPAWGGTMTEMVPGTVEGLYGMPAQLMIPRPDIRTMYYTQATQGYEVDVQGDLTMMDSTRYQGAMGSQRRDLPIRMMPPPLNLMTDPHSGMDVLQAGYYSI